MSSSDEYGRNRRRREREEDDQLLWELEKLKKRIKRRDESRDERHFSQGSRRERYLRGTPRKDYYSSEDEREYNHSPSRLSENSYQSSDERDPRGASHVDGEIQRSANKKEALVEKSNGEKQDDTSTQRHDAEASDVIPTDDGKEGNSTVGNEDPLLQFLDNTEFETKQVGDDIHESVSKLWKNMLKAGLIKERKSDLSKKYPAPKTCHTINPPELNPEKRQRYEDIQKR